MRSELTALLLLSLPLAAVGQVQVSGHYSNLARQIYFQKRSLQSQTADNSKVELTQVNSNELLKLDQSVKSSNSGPLKFAQAIEVNLDSKKNGLWETDLYNGVRYWSLSIQSKTAKSLSLIFDNFNLPEKGEMCIMNDGAIMGSFTAENNNKPNGKFATSPIPGDYAVLIYLEPFSGISEQGYIPKGNDPYFQIKYISHGYRDLFRAVKDVSGPCEIDVKCTESWVIYVVKLFLTIL